MSLLHQQQYDLSKALSCLVPGSGPLLCRDQMEEWAASEANLFEEALDKYGKDFNDIRQDFVSGDTLCTSTSQCAVTNVIHLVSAQFLPIKSYEIYIYINK